MFGNTPKAVIAPSTIRQDNAEAQSALSLAEAEGEKSLDENDDVELMRAVHTAD
jgi:hypothetical protein